MEFNDIYADELDPAPADVIAEVDTCALSPIEPHTHLLEFNDGSILDAHSGLIYEPGTTFSAHDFLNQPDPLMNMGSYRFPGVTFPSDQGLLIDFNNDGIADQTAWGTRVTHVDSYMRSDGTWVQGHYRTTPDGFTGNNLSAFR